MDIISSQIDKARSLLEAGEKLQLFAFVGNLTTGEVNRVGRNSFKLCDTR